MLRPIDYTSEIITTVRRIQNPDGNVPGFEDVLERAGVVDSVIGEGVFYNTQPSVGQLGAVLNIAKNEAAARIIGNESILGGAAVVAALREEQVLAGHKVLDLGCGMVPGFALAAKALGAEMHTADGRPLGADIEGMLDSHTVIDLSSIDVVYDLEDSIGGGFDHVTESIIGYTPDAPEFDHPGMGPLVQIGNTLLKPGGVLYMGTGITIIKL